MSYAAFIGEVSSMGNCIGGFVYMYMKCRRRAEVAEEFK